MRFKAIQILLFLFSYNLAVAQSELIHKKSLSQIKEEHSFLSNFSYPDPNITIVDSILNSNFNEFDSLVDLAFGIKHDSLYDSSLYDLVEQLETETSEKALWDIATEISQFGKEASLFLDQLPSTSDTFVYWLHKIRMMVLGYEIDDFLIKREPDSFDYFGSSQKWNTYYFKIQDSLYRERVFLQKRLKDYIAASSYRMHKEKYHDMVMSAFRKGIINGRYKFAIIQQIITQEVIYKEEQLLNEYTPIIDSIPYSEAKAIISFIWQGSSNKFYPQIYLDLLEHNDDRIVARVLERSSNCWDKKICDEVKIQIEKIFNSGSDDLKLLSAFTLMHDYNYQQAYDYLITKIEATDIDVKYRAISWLGDACNSGDEMSPKLDDALNKYLSSENPKLKRAAIETYLTYDSPNVIEAIIPYANYELDFIAKKVQEKILKYKDKQFSIGKLNEFLSLNIHIEEQKRLLEHLEKMVDDK